MLKSQKSQLTCSNCSRIFKDPVLLPCGDSICRDHLSDRNVCKENRIKCNKRNEEFQVKSNDFKLNDELKNSIESQSYLSDEEKSVKQKLEESIRQFFQFSDEFSQNKSQHEADIFEHFHEMRFKIDEHREELKKRIDDIALAMIDQTNKHENVYLKELKERFSIISFVCLKGTFTFCPRGKKRVLGLCPRGPISVITCRIDLELGWILSSYLADTMHFD
jgi:hypothetical protein